MSEPEKPSLHIDTDWKRQAQEEKRRLAEQEQKKAAAAAPAPLSASPAPQAGASPGADAERAAPPASLATLVQSIMTQILFYLGELAPRGMQPTINLDMAKHQIDLLQVLEEKTRGNLTPEEQRLLDGALYETRMRYVAVASQFATV